MHFVVIDVNLKRIGKGGTNTLTTQLRSVSSINQDGTLYGNPDEDALKYWKMTIDNTIKNA